MRRAVNDALISGAAVAIVIATLIAADARVRERVADIVVDASPSRLASVAAPVGDAGAVLVAAAVDQSVAHAPLVIFAAAATLLLLCMVRT